MNPETRPRERLGFVERFNRTLPQECLDYFVVFGEKHMNYLVTEMVAHYHEERPHQAKSNETLRQASEKQRQKKPKGPALARLPDVLPIDGIQCRERLGGLLKHYSRKAS